MEVDSKMNSTKFYFKQVQVRDSTQRRSKVVTQFDSTQVLVGDKFYLTQVQLRDKYILTQVQVRDGGGDVMGQDYLLPGLIT